MKKGFEWAPYGIQTAMLMAGILVLFFAPLEGSTLIFCACLWLYYGR